MATTACTEGNILRELEEITNPYNFGLQLGIDSKVLDRIDRDHRNDVERQRSEIIKYWYRNTKKSERTWGSLADAIGRLGGHSNLETELRQLGMTPTGPGIPTTPGAASSPMEFSDDLSPTELVSWLSQQFQAKSLTLDPSLGQKLIDNDINGEAFMDLEDSDLVEMGFTKGQRMKIVKIIKGSKEENGSSQTKAASKPVQAVKATSGAPGDASGSKGSGAGDLSPSLERPTESDVLQQFHADLNSSITDPDQFAAQLIQHKFTTKQTADNKMTSGVSDYRKVGNLLGIVDSHISSVSSVSPEKVKERFVTLVSILRNKLGLDDLAQKMETECYGTQQAHPAPSEALSGLNENASGIPQVRNKRNAPSTGRGSEPAPKRIRTNYEGGGGSAHGSSRGASAANTMSDNLPTLPAILRILLPMSSQWMNIGTMLSLKHGRLTAIETRCRGVPDNCLREMLNEWLQQVNPRPTKSALVNVVEMYNPSLAEEISDL